MNRPGRRWGSTLLVVALASAAPAAQTNVARVTGTVKDDGGKPVSGATVTATNPDQAPSIFTATTDTRGRFGILGLRRGNWVFTIAAPGFQTVRAGGDVELRTNPPINVRLMRSVAPSTGPASPLTGAEITALIDAAENTAAGGRFDAAAAAYRDILTKVPSLTSAYLRIGALLEQAGDTAGALHAYRDLARVEPDNAGAAAGIRRLTKS